eukprot:7324372-Alexandrium_andersonii.AAC.1
MIDAPVARTPIRARRAPHEQARAPCPEQPDDEVAVFRLAEAPGAAIGARANIERPRRQDAQPRAAGR